MLKVQDEWVFVLRIYSVTAQFPDEYLRRYDRCLCFCCTNRTEGAGPEGIWLSGGNRWLLCAPGSEGSGVVRLIRAAFGLRMEDDQATRNDYSNDIQPPPRTT